MQTEGRKWTGEADSDNGTVAGQGGRPAALGRFTPTARDSSAHPSRPAAGKGSSQPPASALPGELESGRAARYEPRRGPFDFDMKSVWQRDADEEGDREEKEKGGMAVEGSPGKRPAVTPGYPYGTTQPSAAEEFHGERRHIFPPVPAQPKNQPVNFSKLMSNAYGEEWFQRRDWDEKNPQPNDSLLPHAQASSQTGNE